MSVVEHLEKLRHFQKLAGFRSINEASKVMGISQAGLSKSIASLEQAIGASLFIRSKIGLVLTPEGSITLDAARMIIDKASELEQTLKMLRAKESPKILNIGMYDSIAVYFFPLLKSHLALIYRDIKMRLTIESSDHLLTKMRNNELDIAIGVNFKDRADKNSKFYLLFDDLYSAYISPRLHQNPRELPLIVHGTASDSSGVPLTDLLRIKNLKRDFYTSYNFETIKTLTASGHGIGILPTRVAGPLVQTQQLCAIEIDRVKSVFGQHNIGLLVQKQLLEKYGDFILDIYKLGQNWSKI